MERHSAAGGDWAPAFFLPSEALPDIRCGRFQANPKAKGRTSRHRENASKRTASKREYGPPQ